MKTNQTVNILSRVFIGVSALSLLSVSAMAFVNPQSVMDLVQVELGNTDAFSSIRGVYGGAGLTIFVALLYLMIRNVKHGLVFLVLLWGSYALSRGITIVVEGPLGSFGSQWIVTEVILCTIACVLFILHRNPSEA